MTQQRTCVVDVNENDLHENMNLASFVDAKIALWLSDMDEEGLEIITISYIREYYAFDTEPKAAIRVKAVVRNKS